MRRIAGLALSALGIIVLLVGLVTGMVAKSNDTKTASVTPESTAYVYTTSGVLDLVNSTVTVKAKGAADADITVAFGAPADVEQWAAGLSVTKVTGLKDWGTLASEDSAGETTAPALADSDMWVATKSAKGSIEEKYTVTSHGTIALIATSSDGKAPEIELSWATPNKSNLVPIIVIGLLMLFIGGALVVLERQDRQSITARTEARKRIIERRAARAKAATETLSVSDIAGGSREAQIGLTAGALGAGILPSALRPEEFRSRELSEADRIVLSDDNEAPTPAVLTSFVTPDGSKDEGTAGSAVVDDATTTATEGGAATETVEISENSWRGRWRFAFEDEEN